MCEEMDKRETRYKNQSIVACLFSRFNDSKHKRAMIPHDDNRGIRTNVLFLKTHKTGSSTLQNILFRLGLRHSLNIMVPEKNNYIGYEKPLNNETLSKSLTSIDGKFNIFACHSRYHENTKKFMYNDTIRITLLRSPPEYFESLYNFFHMNQRLKVTFAEIVRSLPNTLVNLTRKKVDQKGINQQSYDLGLSVEVPNDTTIQRFIRYIDEEFDFVMIKEYFDASLVLLADLMRWPLEYVAYVPLMTRAKETKPNLTLTSEDKIKLRELNRADSLLYDYFLGKFRQRVHKYDVHRLIRKLQRLRKLNDDLYKKCISGKSRRGWEGTVSYILKNDSDWECVYATKGELGFISEIRQKQMKQFDRDKQLLDLISK